MKLLILELLFAYFSLAESFLQGQQNVVIDLSHLNNITSFSDIKKDGVRAIIHKASQGLQFKDETYPEREILAVKQALLWGAYHYGCNEGGEKEAERFLKVIFKGWKPCSTNNALNCCYETKFPLIALDWEKGTKCPNNVTMSLKNAEEFVTTIKKITRQPPILYSGSFFLKQMTDNLQSSPLFECPLWISEYFYKDDVQPELPKGWANFTLWQYTDGNSGSKPHSVKGVAGVIDRDLYNNYILTKGLFFSKNIENHTITNKQPVDTTNFKDGLGALWELYSPSIRMIRKPLNLNVLNIDEIFHPVIGPDFNQCRFCQPTWVYPYNSVCACCKNNIHLNHPTIFPPYIPHFG